MADKCNICEKRSGNYKVKDGAICGKCYDKYTNAGYEFKKKLTIEEIKGVIIKEEEKEEQREFKEEDLSEAKGRLKLWAAGFLIGLVAFVILWTDFLTYAFAKERRVLDAQLVDGYEIEDYKENDKGEKRSSVSAKYEFEIDGKKYTVKISTGSYVYIARLKVYKKADGEWKCYLKNPKRHFASLGFLFLSIVCYLLGKKDLKKYITVLKRKKNKV